MNIEREREDLDMVVEVFLVVILWNEGRRVVELGFLVEDLRVCKDCSNLL